MTSSVRNATGQPATAWAPLLFVYLATAGLIVAAAGLVWSPLLAPGRCAAAAGVGGYMIAWAVARVRNWVTLR